MSCLQNAYPMFAVTTDGACPVEFRVNINWLNGKFLSRIEMTFEYKGNQCDLCRQHYTCLLYP